MSARYDKLVVSAQDLDYSTSAEETIPVEFGEREFIIGVKATLIQDMISCIDGDRSILSFGTPSTAILIAPEKQAEGEELTLSLIHIYIGFDIGCCFHLVRGIFVDKAGFQFVLHETVWTVSETFFLFSFGVEENQIAGDIFYF